MSRINLPNGCSCTPLNVWPSNWKTKKASVSKPWYITYRFHMPGLPRPHLVSLRGMNNTKHLESRQKATEFLLSQEIYRLTVEGFNPVMRRNDPVQQVSDVTPKTSIPDALQFAFDNAKIAPNTRADVKSALAQIKKAVEKCHYNYQPIGDVKRKHILTILNECERLKDEEGKQLPWSAHKFNRFRTYLMMLFKVLIKFEAIENNPVSGIDKESVIKKIRPTLTRDQRTAVKNRIELDPNFGRFIHLFFHSGGRMTELTQVKTSDVDLPGQKYKALIKKGKQYREIWRPIKTIALPYWASLMEVAAPGDYLLGRGLVPGPIPCRTDYLTKKWTKIVRDDLKIPVTLYSLKHSNLTEISEMLGAENAAKQAGHTTTALVKNIYDVNYKNREDDKLRNVSNEF